MSWSNRVVWREGMYVRAQPLLQQDRLTEQFGCGRVPVRPSSAPWPRDKMSYERRFHLFADDTLAGDGTRYTPGFMVGDRHVAYRVVAGSLLDPSAPGVLRGFQCPAF